MDIRQSHQYAKFMESIGWVIERVGDTNIFIRKLGPASVIKIQRPGNLDISDWADIDGRVRKYHPLLIKVEPDFDTEYRIRNTEYSPDNWPLLPTKTLILDLNSLSLNSLPRDTRYEIRTSQKNNLTIQQSNNVELFYKLLQETMKIGGWSIPIKREVTNLYSSFQPDNSALLFTTVNREPVSTVNTPVAACFLIWDGDTAHYMYAALTKKGRELGAAYFLLHETIKFCQEKKLKYLDLEGIYDERFPKQTKNWQGFTKFKMGWNGNVVEYPGSWVKYASPILSWLFKLTT